MSETPRPARSVVGPRPGAAVRLSGGMVVAASSSPRNADTVVGTPVVTGTAKATGVRARGVATRGPLPDGTCPVTTGTALSLGHRPVDPS